MASHLQKAIRRGLADEATWATSHLYDVDRAYLSHRLAVMAVEDVGAGNPAIASLLPPAKWGAKCFNSTKSEDDRRAWLRVAATFASSVKDRTPCEWMACEFWLQDFEQMVGPWKHLSPQDCITAAYDQSQPWWYRGLMAWRAVGTDLFPGHSLPVVSGQWPAWVEASPLEARPLLLGFGARQREAHPVFLPLALHARQADPTAHVARLQLPVLKHREWLSSALDKHTREGQRSLSRFWNQTPLAARQALQAKLAGRADPMEVLGTLFFWLSGSKTDQAWDYQLSRQISLDIKKHWLASLNLSGRWLVETFGQSAQLEQAKDWVLPETSPPSPHP